MPVVDASVVVEYLGGGEHAGQAREWLVPTSRSVWVPHLIDVEVGHALRRSVLAGDIDPVVGEQALADLTGMPFIRAGHTGLIERAWELRDNVSFYDAVNVALAERLGCEFVTLDGRLARAARSLVEVVLLGVGDRPRPHES